MKGKSGQIRKWMRKALLLLAIVSVSMLFAGRGEAQSQVFGAVGGAVTDAQGGVVVGAVVNARSLATNAVVTGKADSSGRYLIINLQPGRYELTANVTSFAPYKMEAAVE